VTLAVGLNALHLVPGETGGSELYARRLVGALAALEGSPRIVAFAPIEAVASLEAEPWAEVVEIVRVPVQGRRRARRVLAEQTLLRRAVAGSGVELLHNLFTTAPALPGVPQVTTILDVIYKRFPEAHAGLLTYGMRVLVPLAARRSHRVLTLSQAAKDDIVQFLHVPADRVDVTYLGPALQDDQTVSSGDVRRRLELGRAPIVLTVSAKRPHKNLERLLEAFSRVRTKPNPVLVVPGRAPTSWESAVGSGSWAGWKTTCSTASTGQLRASSSHLSPRASACPSSTLSFEARRPPARMLRLYPKSAATLSFTSIRPTSERFRRRSCAC
jgi:glycosyltransferase involved in cell wall biosynthesis